MQICSIQQIEHNEVIRMKSAFWVILQITVVGFGFIALIPL